MAVEWNRMIADMLAVKPLSKAKDILKDYRLKTGQHLKAFKDQLEKLESVREKLSIIRESLRGHKAIAAADMPVLAQLTPPGIPHPEPFVNEFEMEHSSADIELLIDHFSRYDIDLSHVLIVQKQIWSQSSTPLRWMPTVHRQVLFYLLMRQNCRWRNTIILLLRIYRPGSNN